jgi:hypothetical protein
MKAMMFQQLMEQANQPSLTEQLLGQAMSSALQPIQFQNYIG